MRTTRFGNEVANRRFAPKRPLEAYSRHFEFVFQIAWTLGVVVAAAGATPDRRLKDMWNVHEEPSALSLRLNGAKRRADRFLHYVKFAYATAV